MKQHRPTTLGEFLVENQEKFPYATGELSQLLSSIRLASKVVNREINKAGLADILGHAGSENIQGENQMKLDVFANDTFIRTLRSMGEVCGVASEELEDYIKIGIISDALRNYLLRLGWSYKDKEIFTKQESIDLFDLNGVGKSPSKLDMSRIYSINETYIKTIDEKNLFNFLKAYVSKYKKPINHSKEAVLLKSMNFLKNKEFEDLIKNQCKDYTIFRFFNVGGGKPSNPEGLYAATINACKSGTFTIYGHNYNTKDGTCVRDYVHVDDLCDAIIKSIYEPGAMTEYEPIGSGKSYTVLEYVNAFLEENGPKFKVKFGRRREGDNESSEVPHMSKFMNPQKTLKDIVKL